MREFSPRDANPHFVRGHDVTRTHDIKGELLGGMTSSPRHSTFWSVARKWLESLKGRLNKDIFPERCQSSLRSVA